MGPASRGPALALVEATCLNCAARSPNKQMPKSAPVGLDERRIHEPSRNTLALPPGSHEELPEIGGTRWCRSRFFACQRGEGDMPDGLSLVSRDQAPDVVTSEHARESCQRIGCKAGASHAAGAQLR